MLTEIPFSLFFVNMVILRRPGTAPWRCQIVEGIAGSSRTSRARGLFSANQQKAPRQQLSADIKTDKNVKSKEKVRGSREIEPAAEKKAILFYIII